MKVCFVITTFNRQNLLQQSIESVLPQLGADDVLLVVDDASSDGTQSYMNELDHPQLEYIRLSENSGINRVRQTAITEASKLEADWISFIDDDDRVVPGLRGMLDDVLNSADGMDKKWIAFPAVDPDGCMLSRFPGQGQYSYIEDYMGDRVIRGDYQHFLHMGIAAECSFTDLFRNAEEWYFWCQVSQLAPWFISSDAGVIKQYLEEGLSKSGFNRDRKLQVAEMKVAALRDVMSDKNFSIQLLNLGRAQLKSDLKREARASFCEALGLKKTNFRAVRYLIQACVPW